MEETSAAKHLPEVDAVPDGFVTESLPASIPDSALEKSSDKSEENDCPSPQPATLQIDLDEVGAADDHNAVEKFDSVPGVSPVGEIEESLKTSSEREVTVEEVSPPHPPQSVQETPSKPSSSHGGNTNVAPNGVTETKLKGSKRSAKSEREFLEFTLRYQQVIAERDSAISVRDRLESLCRELQRQNKMLMDECKRVSSEGQNLRLDLSTKFQDAIKDVSVKLDEQKEECITQLKENEMLRNKLKQLCDQYSLAEQQFTQKLKQKDLELQLADLKLKQQEEKVGHEQSQMKLYAEQISQLLTTEKSLRMQLNADGEKFQQFQDALVKSNEVFTTFKQEMEKMGKSIKDLRKDNAFLKDKCEKTDITLIQLVEERERMKQQLEKSKKQKEKLESLCRSLQAERKNNSTTSNNTPELLNQ